MIDTVAREESAPNVRVVPTKSQMLIVEDDRIFGQRLSKAFVDRGFDVEVCETVGQALAVIHVRPLDVVITDLHIGDQSGLAVVEGIQALGRDTKTLVLTGYGNVSNVVTAVKLGATEFLSKPADADEILEVLGIDCPTMGPSNRIMMSPDLVRWDHIVSVFEGTGKNMSASARILNMHRRTLQRMLARGGPGSH